MTLFSATDGTIQKIVSTPGKLSIDFIDWQEQRWTIFFEEAIAFQSIGAEGEEVSEISTIDTSFINLIDPKELNESSKSYSFISAWSSNPVLIVIASNFNAVQSDKNS